MSEISQADLIAFIREELETRETSYPVRVEMGRLSKKDAERGLAMTRAVLAALTGESVRPLEQPMVTLKHHRETVNELEERLRNAVATTEALGTGDQYLKIEPALHQIHICARENRAKCEGCNATAMALDETFGIKG